MNKLFTKIAALALGAVMAVGVGVAVASKGNVSSVNAAISYDDLTLVTSASTLDTSKKYVYGTGKTSGSKFLTDTSDSSWGGYTTTLNSATQWSVSGTNVSSFYLYSGTKMLSSLTSNSFALVTSNPTNQKLDSSGTLHHTSTDARTLRCNGTSGFRWYANTTGTQCFLYEVATTSSKTATTTTIEADHDKTTLDVTVSPADSVELTSTISYSGGTVSSSVAWESSNPLVASVSAASGTKITVTAVAKGTVTITATYAGNDTYDSSYGEIEISVINPSERTYSLEFDKGIVTSTGWTNSYGEHGPYSYSEKDIGTVSFSFAAASKQTGTITKYPVGKDGAVEMVLTSSTHYIGGVTFNGEQWGSKDQTMNIKYSTDGGENYTSTGVSSSTFSVTKNDLTIGTNAIQITFDNSSNQIGHKSFEVIYAENPAPKTLSKIELSGDYPTTFQQGDDFSHAGMTVTATYSDSNTADVTSSATFSGYDMSSISEQTVTVSYTDEYGSASTTYTITVNEATHTHNWVAGTVHAPTCTQNGYTEYECSVCHDTKQDDVISALGHDYSSTVHAPTCTEAGYTEWVCSRCGDHYQDSPTAALGHNYVDGVCTRCGEEQILPFVVLPSDGTAVTSSDFTITKLPVTVSVSSSTLTSDQIRVFKNQTITISGALMKKIVFTCTANGDAKYGPGCFASQEGYSFEAEGNKGTWVGSSNSAEFTASSDQVRISQIEIYFTADAFANLFLTNLTCTSSGASAPSFATGYSWSTFRSIYSSLDATEKGLLKSADYTKQGTGADTTVTPETGTTQLIANAMAKYDYIESKYNPTNDDESPWRNFIGRSVTPLSTQRIILDSIIGESNVVMVIVVISLISMTAVGGYFFIKRRKEN